MPTNDSPPPPGGPTPGPAAGATAVLPPPPRVIVLTGPTASGKEGAAVPLAERLGAEIVSADSMKVYRGMDIGTAKAGPAQRVRVPHHCLDLADVSERFSTGRWLAAAEAAIADIHGRGKRALLVGGTALYLKAFHEGLLDGPPADAAVRAELEAEADRLGAPALHRRLAEADPVLHAKLHPNDAKRIVRALEVHRLTGRPLSSFQTQWSSPATAMRDEPAADRNPPVADPSPGDAVPGGETPVPAGIAPPTGRPGVCWLGLRRSKPDQDDRIARRIHRMFDAGLVDEVRRLRDSPGGIGPTAAESLGVPEVLELLAGRWTREEAIRRTYFHTRQFAKRQWTWFRRFTWVRWLDVAPDDTAVAVADRLAAMALTDPTAAE